MTRLLTLAFAAAFSTAALAAEPPKSPDPTGAMTVLQVLNIGQSLRQLGTYRDNTGKEVKVDFRFSGDMLFDISVNVAASDLVQRNVETTRNELVKRIIGDDSNALNAAEAAAAKERDPAKQAAMRADLAPLQAKVQKELNEVNEEMQKVYDKPAGALLVRFKRASFCVDAKPDGSPAVGCQAVNVIPPSILAPLMAITDR